MCSRFSLMATSQLLIERYTNSLGYQISFENIDLKHQHKPRYNIAPSQHVPIIMQESKKIISYAKWGLVPYFVKEKNTTYNMINARAETIHEKKSFKKPFKSQRCLIPADGFYEWRKELSGKTPYRFVLKSKQIFSFAGLYDIWKHKEKEIVSCTIITTTPNTIVKKYHDRMPVILKQKDEKYWLEDHSSKDLQKLFVPLPEQEMHVFQISKKINSPREDLPMMVLPVPKQTQLL